MNLFRESVGISSRSAVQGSSVPRIGLRASIYYHPKKKKRGDTYRALKKKSSQVKIGRAGRKNCLVIGISRASIKRAAAPVFINGPGA
jgi:hypothetical protein